MSPRRAPRSVSSESPLSGTWRGAPRERAVLAGIAPAGEEHALDELDGLARAAGAQSVGRVVQSKDRPDPATFIGKGKVKEIHELVDALGADAVIFDDELSPGQLRNLEQTLGTKVIDRTALILDIFALHARSGEGKAQVELAQLNYLLPRLRGWGEAMSRLGGGIGTRGPGETKLETDRQHIRKRIAKLHRDIADLARTRQLKRSRRERSGVPQIALAGYTNAGKSTLLNTLTAGTALVADQPFATLDPTTRRVVLSSGRRATISDTVGFVRKLPHDLVEAFKSTLEEVARADLVLHVADASAADMDGQIQAVREVLAQIGAVELPEVLALNKWDVADDVQRVRMLRRHPDAIPVSALTGDGVDRLLDRLAIVLPDFPLEVHLLIPADRADVVARLYRLGHVLRADHGPAGTSVVARIPRAELHAVQEFVVQPLARRA